MADKADVIAILDRNRLLALATNRPDGFPHCTIVGYANDGLRIFMVVSPDSQKRANLERDSRVSAAIGADVADPMAITGLSFAGHAHAVTDPGEIRRVFDLLMRRYPEYMQMPAPAAGDIAVFEIRPEIVSVLDYSKGFGHTELVQVSPSDWRAVLAERGKRSDRQLPT